MTVGIIRLICERNYGPEVRDDLRVIDLKQKQAPMADTIQASMEQMGWNVTRQHL